MEALALHSHMSWDITLDYFWDGKDIYPYSLRVFYENKQRYSSCKSGSEQGGRLNDSMMVYLWLKLFLSSASVNTLMDISKLNNGANASAIV